MEGKGVAVASCGATVELRTNMCVGCFTRSRYFGIVKNC